MAECFRFLINVDRCINTSDFDIFFYKLESKNKFRLNQVQFNAEDGKDTLRFAVDDIRMYIEKFPYNIGDYQIILAMRTVFNEKITEWRDSMLCRLLHINHELRRARIYINSKENNEKAVNLIMLYDADFSASLPHLENYLNSERITHDCELMFHEIGASFDFTESSQFQDALDHYKNTKNKDEAVIAFVQSYIDLMHIVEKDELNDRYQEYAEENDSIQHHVLQYLKSYLDNFSVLERMIDRNNRRDNILSLLRIVEYINMSMEGNIGEESAVGRIVTLSERCRANWEKVWNDDTLEMRYANMMYRYEMRLKAAKNDMEQQVVIPPEKNKPPKYDVPTNDAIKSKKLKSLKDKYEQIESGSSGGSIRHLLERFVSNRMYKDLKNQWNAVYDEIKSTIGNMERDLRDGARELSTAYSATLEKRKRDTLHWNTDVFFSGENPNEEMVKLEREKETLMKELKSPSLTPSLKFQDQLNMENALEQENINIRFYIDCIDAIKVSGFLILMAVLVGIAAVHYAFLQPYVFSSSGGFLTFLVYLAVTAFVMLFAWAMPYKYFVRKIKESCDNILASMDLYIKGYFDKADNFERYINVLNQLDYITRYSRMYEKAMRYTNTMSKGNLWHKIQVEKHLEKLLFFSGLIDLHDSDAETDDRFPLPELKGDRIISVTECPLYWPQA